MFRETDSGIVSGRLECNGPVGETYPQTSNRAELRAVISALQFRAWSGDGIKDLVIATDSEYVVKGVTDWVWAWIQRGWVTRQGNQVQNQDLWMELLAEMDKHNGRGLDIGFWKVPRDWNTTADDAARAGARREEIISLRKVMGILL